MKTIVQDGEPVLRQKANIVPEEMFGTPELAAMVRDMEEALDAEADGVALAAPQIGLPWRIFIVRYDRMAATEEDAPSQELSVGVYVNPEFVRTSRRKEEMEEGCLSVRGKYGKTLRHERATVRARDVAGARFERGGGGILAQAFQHEIDHLEGILFIDHATDIHEAAPRSAPRTGTNFHEPFVFFGTPYVARDTLALLVKSGYRPSLVVTSPDAPRGRGLAVAPSETKEWALEHTFPVIAPEKLNAEALAAIRDVGASYAIVVAYGKILPTALIDSFPKGVLNVHYSLLPKYRGASPVQAALLAGDTVTGVTIQKMAPKLDAGDIIAQAETEIGPEETTRELRPRLIAIGAALLIEALPFYESGKLTPQPQDEAQATHAGKIEKEDGELSLSGDARANWNTYRAYAESPGTYFYADKGGKKLRVKIAAAAWKDGVFLPTRVVPEGKKEMGYEDFLRGGYQPL